MSRQEAISMAHAVLDMADEIGALRQENEHLRELVDMYAESARREQSMQQESIKDVFTALLSPDNIFSRLAKESKPTNARSGR